MTLDLAAIELRVRSAKKSASRYSGATYDEILGLLALAKEALAAREFHAAYKAYQSSGGRDQALLDTAMQRMRDHRELVSAHQSGGAE